MQAQQVRKAQRAEPFRPFRIMLADGRSFLVDHPEFMLVTRDGRTIVLETLDDGVSLLDTLMVTGIEFERS